MPYVYFETPGVAPLIAEATSDVEMLEILRTMKEIPPDKCQDAATAHTWLKSLPAPNGWFDTVEEMEATIKQTLIQRDAQMLGTAMLHLGAQRGKKVSQHEMALMLGLSDPGKDGSPIRKILNGKNRLGNGARRVLALTLRDGPMNAEQEAAQLASLDSGAWHSVDHKSLRRLKNGKVTKH